jgi:lipoate-protein ligase A
MFPLYSGGGAIVFTEGDVAVGLMINKEAGFDKDYLIKNIVEIISRHTDKAVAFSGNDILVGGEKVSGSTTYEKNDMFAIIFNLSFSDKTELISKICTKHSAKQPGYIDFMTREDFKREVLEWLPVR